MKIKPDAWLVEFDGTPISVYADQTMAENSCSKSSKVVPLYRRAEPSGLRELVEKWLHKAQKGRLNSHRCDSSVQCDELVQSMEAWLKTEREVPKQYTHQQIDSNSYYRSSRWQP